MPGCYRRYRVHIRWQADLVDYQDGLRARSDRLFEPCGIQIVSRQVNITEDWSCPNVRNGVSGCNEGEAGAQHFVALTDAAGEQCKMKRSSAGRDGNRMLAANV